MVREVELHPSDDNVQALRLGPPVLLVHEVRVVDDLCDPREYRVLQRVLFEEGLEGGVFPAV